VSNLLVEICYNNSAYTQYSPVNATSISGMTWGQYTDLPTGDGCTALTAGTSQAIRPNLCFVFTPLSENTPSTNVPDKFSLSQNYPNPFNPVTKIEFTLPKQTAVIIKIFDVLGREIRTLVNDVKPAGYYSVDFNASELSSGVYYYKIEAGNFTDVKKMTIIK